MEQNFYINYDSFECTTSSRILENTDDRLEIKKNKGGNLVTSLSLKGFEYHIGATSSVRKMSDNK